MVSREKSGRHQPRAPKQKFKKSMGDRLFDGFNVLFMLFILFVTLYPFWEQLVMSFSSGYAVYEGGIKLWPKQFSLEAFQVAFDYDAIWVGYRNTIFRAIIGTAFSLMVSAMLAYPLSKKHLPARRFFTTMLIFTMIFSGGLIPSYLLIQQLHLFDTFWALILPTAVVPWNIFVLRNFFMSIPSEIEESVQVDGGGWYTIFFKFVLPLSKPVLATVGLWIMVSHWNAWLDALLYVRDPAKQVLQIILRNILVVNDMTDINNVMNEASRGVDLTGPTLKAAVVMMSILPMLIIYPFIQKYFTKGVMVGSVKG